ncbi:glycosyltransferase 87 family protein [Solwaraspora sp. WMMD937]|uniref:glycosyltransferase 87 family protein n=1 Tax=Solwaraspora sp. WMMD937 TaxID=3016090 RepID=UPI00249B4EAD|nr:glycosyltransferase 87 family protein [Solwaraspora sp. WMMD937]WFE24131.1 glycosyltransferase 87 family protein [Solwaraspora sp. WMMD937]
MPADTLPDGPAPRPVDDRSHTPRRVAVVVALSTAVVAALIWYGNRHDFYDLKIYLSAMRWWADGNQLYDYVQPDIVQGQLYFTYPPFTALLLRPFAAVGAGTAAAVFTVGTLLAVMVTTVWLVTPIARRRGLPRWWLAGLAVPLVVLIEPTRETIFLGQINMLLVVLILADLLFAVPKRSRWAGVGTGLATAIKLFPGIFIVYLLVTRRWRAALVSCLAAAAATGLAAAVAPTESWRFWFTELWSTDRVGRSDYTGNQSLQGLLARLAAPAEPDRLVWLVLVAVAAGYGLWRAARAVRAGDELAGLTLTGLVAALIAPITWPHHVYWFVPALIVLLDAALPDRPLVAAGPQPAAARSGVRAARPAVSVALAAVIFAALVVGVVSLIDWGHAKVPTDDPATFVLRNLYVLAAALLLVSLPIRRHPTSAPGG